MTQKDRLRTSYAFKPKSIIRKTMKTLLLVLFSSFILFADAPKLVLLKTYHDDMNVLGWVMSEKLDGVRAFWDGKELISRSGRVFQAPKTFTQGFPSFALDGELWTKRGDFEHIVSIVNSKESLTRWESLTYNIFEVPDQEGDLFQRLHVVESFLSLNPLKRLRVIKQIEIKEHQEVKAYFDEIIDSGGEGIVIRDPALGYYTGRTSDSLKYKPFMDAECKIVSIIEGKGKFSGQMGAVECFYKGKKIKIGSGFTAQQRKDHPAIGTTISFKYYGLTHLGNPKYPVFLRVRSDDELSLSDSEE